MGDFNVVRRRDERLNSHFCASSALAFNRFIQTADLHDLKMGGYKFTFFQQVGGKLSKLDRILICSKILTYFPSASSIALPRDLSDHSPVIFRAMDYDFGPPPFKFFNSWILRDGIEEVVKSAWMEFSSYGAPDFFLNCKLKFLKNVSESGETLNFRGNRVI